MADYSCEYELDCGAGGTITFNDGTLGNGSADDLYWISTLHGLDGPTLRVPVDDVPFGDGGIVHRSWMGPRHPVLEGNLIVQSVGLGGCQARLNEMEEALRLALDEILAPTAGTLTWTPTDLGITYSLEVFYEVPLDVQPTDNYLLRSFNFGLISNSPVFTASS
jgi:hypothetical protein